MFTGFAYLPGLRSGLFDGISYWWSQHPVARGGQPVSYHARLLAAYEWPVLLLAAPGAVRALRRPTTFSAFLVWDTVVSLAVYSWAGEKFPWLVLHPLLPLVLLAGLGVQTLWDAGRRARVGVTAAVALAATYGAAVGVFAAIDHPADPRELLVSVQTSTDVDQIRQRLEALRRPAHQTPLAVVIDSSSGATWPWAWYLRDIPASYIRLDITAPPADADVMILTAAARRLLPAEVTNDYEVRRFRLRVWWQPDYGDASPVDWIRWLATRDPWSSTGSFDEWLYVKRDLR